MATYKTFATCDLQTALHVFMKSIAFLALLMPCMAEPELKGNKLGNSACTSLKSKSVTAKTGS
jgi:hypothetical protein